MLWNFILINYHVSTQNVGYESRALVVVIGRKLASECVTMSNTETPEERSELHWLIAWLATKILQQVKVHVPERVARFRYYFLK